ncbi:MAG: homocysteine S-methyltransferase family protein [Candidatus Ancaeobacter aquaticus]|nr:homocysteine S-methyltransferase family protein [Candidatus Ancaeobacter aquaticus]
MENILQVLKKKILVYDGALGTMLQEKGALAGVRSPEEVNLISPDTLRDIHREYIDAGADVIETNTFGVSSIKLKEFGLEDKMTEIIKKGIQIAVDAASGKAYVAASIGPLPKQLEPLGELTFDQAYTLFAEQVKVIADTGADLILIETMSDIKETKAAVIAAKEHSSLPVQVQMTFDKGKWTLSGTPPEVAAVVLGACGADIIGVNCSSGPEELLYTVEMLGRYFDGYISVLPNAGLPELVDGKTIFRATPEYMAEYAIKFAERGVNLIGGCCGTTPDHIRACAQVIKGAKPVARDYIGGFMVASRTQVVRVSDDTIPLVIGERINPTNRKDLSAELKAGKMTLLKNDALTQTKNGASILDINVGVPGEDEVALMGNAVSQVQNTVGAAIAIDTMDQRALEEGLKECAGKPLINSVNGKAASMQSVIPLAVKYGAALIALTLDEKGIPTEVKKRVALAQVIIKEAEGKGIRKDDILVDSLTLTVSSEPEGVRLTLDAVKEIKALGYKNSLGVSNISFGLPGRKYINGSFLSMAIGAGLDAAIINPNNQSMMDAFLASSVLVNRDKLAVQYIAEIKKRDMQTSGSHIAEKGSQSGSIDIKDKLYNAILYGQRDEIAGLIDEGVKTGLTPMDINMSLLVPALEEVGKKFESKEYFLPQLILSAETMRKAFEHVKTFTNGEDQDSSKAKIVIATVEGDVHDIGKNIVIAVLENYGYEIIDLGKSVSSKEIIDTVKEHKADIVGLSALMTTTMTEMKKVISEIGAAGLNVKTIIGGAVVTPAYAKEIKADAYAKDAIAAVRIIKDLLSK